MDSSQDHGSPIARIIWIVCTPIIFSVGVPGNMITITVLSRPAYKKTSTSVFLLLLAFADLLVLMVVMPRWWLVYVFGLDIRHISNAFCKVHWFFTYFSGSFSSTFLIILTIERIISIMMPYKLKKLFTVKTAVVISATVTLFLIALHGHNVYGMELYYVSKDNIQLTNNSYNIRCVEKDAAVLDNIEINVNHVNYSVSGYVIQSHQNFTSICNGTFSLCMTSIDNTLTKDVHIASYDLCKEELREETVVSVCFFRDQTYGKFNMGAYQILTTFLYTFGTEGCIIIGLIIILRQLSISRQLRKGVKLNTVREKPTHVSKSSFENHATQITRSLILVNIVFIICKTPIQIFLIGRPFWIDIETGMTVGQEIVWVCCNQLYYINHCVNFILYFLSGEKFRRQLKETFDWHSRDRNARQNRNVASVSNVLTS